MASALPTPILDHIFAYIADSKPRKRRAGYTYEAGSDDEEEDSDGDEEEDYSDDDEEEDYSDDDDDDEEDYSDEDDEEDYDNYSDESRVGFGSDRGDPPMNIKDFVFLPTYTLRPLLFVNKHWRDIAERRLYASISVGSDSDDDRVCGADQAVALAGTLQQHPELAGMVREVRLATMDCKKPETVAHSQILAACTLANKVTIMGYNGYVLEELTAALKGLKYLRSLTVSR